MSEIKVNSIKGVGASAAAITVNNTDGTCTLASGSKLNNCTTDGTTNFTIADGNLVVGTARHGIDFSAQTAFSGMSAELLDHYEEGSWTPQISQGGTAFTVNSSGCQYTRVGALVFICFDFTQSNGGPITNVYGLPFGVFKHSTFYFGFVSNSSGGTQGTSDITGGRIDFGNNLTLAPAGGSSSQQLASGQRVIGSGCYITDA